MSSFRPEFREIVQTEVIDEHRRRFFKLAGLGALAAGVGGGAPAFSSDSAPPTRLVQGYAPDERMLDQTLRNYDLRSPIRNPVDLWLYTVHMPAEFPSTWVFGFGEAPPIPAGFFGSGSDPWSGGISCVGIPLEPNGRIPTADLVVRHEAVRWIPNPSRNRGPREIPSQLRFRTNMHRLHERGTAPLTVTYDHGRRQETWRCEVRMAENHPGGGHVDITWLDANGAGGMCDIEIAVKVEFIFTKDSGDGRGRQVRMTSPVEWLSETQHPFVRRASDNLRRLAFISPGSDGNFIPASRNLGGGVVTLAGACSKNANVAHSFVLAPRAAPGDWGTSPAIRQFPQRVG